MDPGWLAQEAQKLHSIFQNAFFAMIVAFLLLAVVLEFLKMPIGESPVFTTLVGRSLMAAFFLVALPEVMNFVADATDSIAKEIGDLNNFQHVLSRLGDKLKDLSFSWTSVRDVVTILLSFLSFFILYVTVYFAEAAFLYCWTLIYVFSPLVFALYIFPRTAGATATLFRSIIEVSLWKICWAAMSALLWSTALSDLNKPESNVSWLAAIVLNLMLMISVLLTPKLIRMLLTAGVAEVSSGLQSAAMNAASLTPPVALARAKAGLLFLPLKAGSFAKRQASAGVGKSWEKIKDHPRAPSFMKSPQSKHSPAPYKKQTPTGGK